MARKNNRPRRVNEILSAWPAVRPVACFAKVYHPVYGLPLELVEELESDWSVLEEFMDRAVMECAPSQRLKDRDDLLRLLGLEGVEMAKSFYSALITQGHIVEGPQGLEYTQLCAKSIQRGRKIYPARSLRRLYVDALGLIPLTREYQPGTRLIPYNSQDLYISLHHEEGAKVPLPGRTATGHVRRAGGIGGGGSEAAHPGPLVRPGADRAQSAPAGEPGGPQ